MAFNLRKQNLLLSMYTFRNILADYLIRTNSFQVIAESLRQNLAKNSYFQYETIFERLDKHHKGYLIPADFSQFLLENSVYPTQQQLYILFRDFDVNKIGTVTLQMFRRQIFPRQNQKLTKQASSRKYYPSRQRLELDLQYLLTKYLEHKIKTHNELQILRHKLQQIYLNYTQEAFILIDRNKKQQLIPSDIDYFLRSSAKLLKPQQVDRIFRTIGNFNNKNEAKLISYDRFMEHLNPFGMGFYLGYAERLVEKKELESKFISRKVLMNDTILNNSKGQMKALIELQNLRKSRRQLQRRILQQQTQMTRQRILEQELRRKNHFLY